MANSSMNDIADDVSEAVLRALHRIGSETSNIRRRVRRDFDRTGKNVSHIADELWHDTRVQGRRAAQTAVEGLRGRPVLALALGAAFGAVAVTLLSRRE